MYKTIIKRNQNFYAMKSYDTVTEAINDLRRRGYSEDLNLSPNHNSLHCHRLDLLIAANDFQVDEIHRFEGNTDPGDEMVVYAISSEFKQIKGVLTEAYGMYAESLDEELLNKLKVH